jgi:hypothetical protein
MTETEKEVNPEVERIILPEDLADTAESEEEEVIPPGAVEETPTPETPKPEEKVPDSSPEPKEVPSKPNPAPVPGETPREKALRLEVVRLRQKNRETAIGQMVDALPKEETKPASDRLSKLRERYTTEELANMEEAIDVLAESKGYVKSEQTYKQIVQGTVDSFIESHPEYDPKNDNDDIRWTRFQEILQSGIYNLQGKNGKQLNTIFEKVNEDIVKELGESDIESTPRKIAAQQQKIKSVSHTGGTRTESSSPKKGLAPEVKSFFKGFDDEDLV